MATQARIAKSKRTKLKYSTRRVRRCSRCGRLHPLRKFGLCRICFRELAEKGEIPGVRRSSW